MKLSVTHKRLHELHPADVADILEQLTAVAARAASSSTSTTTRPPRRSRSWRTSCRPTSSTTSTSQRASDILEMMDPDDAADIIGDLPYDKAETLLRLMGVREARQVRKLLGYKEKTAGGIMTPEVTTVTEDMTVQQVIEHLRGAARREREHLLHLRRRRRRARSRASSRCATSSSPSPDTQVADDRRARRHHRRTPTTTRSRSPRLMSKYDLLALPVVDETGRILGIVTVDDALDVMEQESAEDLALATGSRAAASDRRASGAGSSRDGWLDRVGGLFLGVALGRARCARFTALLAGLLVAGRASSSRSSCASPRTSRATSLAR